MTGCVAPGRGFWCAHNGSRRDAERRTTLRSASSLMGTGLERDVLEALGCRAGSCPEEGLRRR
ncbi:MAG: hypothetical protein KatS3mg132_679 [Limisphaera sp.]|nr:MAG: hypothetical protein KatS3mg132_679 [Limisphaera sp.]